MQIQREAADDRGGEAMTETAIGTVVDGRYRVISRLGTGGMADVFLAEDEQLGRNVALKLLHRRFAADPGFVERFRREAYAAACLSHPNVVSIYDRGEFDGTYYIAMEYLPGRSLKQLIREEAPLEPERAIEITLQILRASRFAHKQGVIHRDLKPHNVIVGEGDHVKVTDFGIARAGASDMTETGSIMGTAQYLSPEQAQGHDVGETSDLYSIAVILYEMLTGRVPFDADSAVTIALKHVSEAPPPPRSLNPQIPLELEQVVLWALNKNPADRPADAEQFINVLEQVRESMQSGLRGEVTASMAVVAADPAAGTLPTTVMPGGAPPGLDMVPPAIVDGVAYPYGDDGHPPGKPTGPDDRDESRIWPWVLALVVLLLIAGGGATAYLLTRPTKVVVPNVVGETQASATATLSNFGFTPNVINETLNIAAGTVIRQSPSGGIKASKGSIVTLTVSSGPGTAQVPSVTDYTEKAAKETITNAGLTVAQVLSEPSSTVAKGSATRTVPNAGQTVQAGSGITLYVSSGPAPVPVPSVLGDTAQGAKSSLAAAGFGVSQTQQQTSNPSEVGTVINQNPAPPAKAPAGTTVMIVVGSPPTTATVPGVVGFTASAAASTLASSGFSVAEKTKDVSNANQDGIVLDQSPTAGATAQKSSTVRITVGRYKAPPPPPTTTSTTTTPTTTTTTTTSTTTTPGG
jgi:serine/threonine-protein kinase